MPDAIGATAACAAAYETAIHRKAKDIILGNSSIVTPALMARYGDRTRQAIAPKRTDYTPIAAELWLGDIRRRPDVMVETANGRLAIEIFYRHRCPPDKIAALVAGRVTTIEIDLSGCDRDVVSDETALTALVLRSARRNWLYHADKDRLDADFAAEVVEQHRLAAEREAVRRTEMAAAEKKRAEERARIDAETEVERESRLAETREKEAAERVLFERKQAARRASEREESERKRAEVDVAAKVRWLARDDANGTSQRCHVCDKTYSPFGYGLPPKVPQWACREHREAPERT
jgi:flagellar biosynthesis GTPase FlhF